MSRKNVMKNRLMPTGLENHLIPEHLRKTEGSISCIVKFMYERVRKLSRIVETSDNYDRTATFSVAYTGGGASGLLSPPVRFQLVGLSK